MKYCPVCEKENSDELEFCSYCGGALRGPDDALIDLPETGEEDFKFLFAGGLSIYKHGPDRAKIKMISPAKRIISAAVAATTIPLLMAFINHCNVSAFAPDVSTDKLKIVAGVALLSWLFYFTTGTCFIADRVRQRLSRRTTVLGFSWEGAVFPFHEIHSISVNGYPTSTRARRNEENVVWQYAIVALRPGKDAIRLSDQSDQFPLCAHAAEEMAESMGVLFTPPKEQPFRSGDTGQESRRCADMLRPLRRDQYRRPVCYAVVTGPGHPFGISIRLFPHRLAHVPRPVHPMGPLAESEPDVPRARPYGATTMRLPRSSRFRRAPLR